MDYDYEQIKGRCDANEIKRKDVSGQEIGGIERDTWGKLNYPEEDKIQIQKAIFGDNPSNPSISLTREQVFDETKTETKTKIMKVLMWGYKKPSGHPSKDAFESIAKNLTRLKDLFEEIEEKQNKPGLERNDIENLFRNFENPKIKGLGKNAVATKSKLLYFFDVSFDGKRCLIYDSNVIRFLNHTDDKLTLREDCYGEYLILNSDLKAKLKDFIRKAPWEPTDDCYFKYLDLMDKLKNDLNIDDPAKIELYMYEGGKKLADDKKKELKKNANLKDNS